MTEDDDDEWLSPKLRTLLRVVVGAINSGATDVHAAARASMNPPPPREEIDAVLNILEMVNHQPGESAGLMMGRIQDAFEAATQGEDYEPPPEIDDRY